MKEARLPRPQGWIFSGVVTSLLRKPAFHIKVSALTSWLLVQVPIEAHSGSQQEVVQLLGSPPTHVETPD